jgi:hypothetical protein
MPGTPGNNIWVLSMWYLPVVVVMYQVGLAKVGKVTHAKLGTCAEVTSVEYCYQRNWHK